MNKEFEDLRRHIQSDKKTWKGCLDTMEVVKEKFLPDGAGVNIEFMSKEGKGVSLDIVGKDYKEYKNFMKAPKEPKTEVKPEDMAPETITPEKKPAKKVKK